MKVLLVGFGPAVVAGDGVGRGGAVRRVVRVAGSLGAVVYHAPMNDRLDFPMAHPAYRGMLPPENDRIRRALDRHDVVLLAGVRAFVPHHYTDAAAVGPDTALVQVDDDPGQIGRIYPAAVGLPGDVRAVLGALADELEVSGEHAAPDPRGRRPARRYRTTTRCRCTRASPRPPSPAHLPAGAVVVEEAITTGLLVREHLSAGGARLVPPHGRWRSGLGRGRGGRGLTGEPRDAASSPLLGDGCALFGVQALWTAAREHVPVTFVVFANGEYRTLKQTLTRMRSGRVEPFLGMDLDPADDRLAGARRGRWACPACGRPASSTSPTS